MGHGLQTLMANICVCRFLDWTPSSVESLCFSSDSNFLAVGRLDGSIQFLETVSWHEVLSLQPRSKEASVRSLFFVLNCVNNNGAPKSRVARRGSNGSKKAIASPLSIRPDVVDITPSESSDESTTDDDECAVTKSFDVESQRGQSSISLFKYRFFSSGIHGEITEWDLVTQLPKSTSVSGGGCIFDSCPSPDGTHIAAACEDGSVRIFAVDNDEGKNLQVAITLPKHSCRLLCVCYGSSSQDLIFSGTSNGLILKWSLETRSCVSKVKLSHPHFRETGKLTQGHSTIANCQVWAIRSLPTHSIVATGDSYGFVKLWDENMCTLLQSFKQHQADVTNLAIGPSFNVLYSVGVDGRLIHYSLTAGNACDWVVTGFKNTDRNDVKAVASSNSGIVASAGLSGRLVTFDGLTSLMHAAVKSYHLQHFPSISSQKVSVATAIEPSSPPVILVQYSHYLEIWSVAKLAKSTTTGLIEFDAAENVTGDDQNGKVGRNLAVNSSYANPHLWSDFYLPPGHPMKCAEIKLKGEARVKSSALSSNGQYIVALSDLGISAFRFSISELEIKEVRLKRLKISTGYAIKFISESSFVVCVKSPPPDLVVLGQSSDSQNQSFDVKLIDMNLRKETFCFKDFPSAINRIEVSPSGSCVVCIDVEGRAFLLDIVLKQKVCTLPHFNLVSRQPTNTDDMVISSRSSLSISNRQPDHAISVAFKQDGTKLAVFSANKRFYIYDVKEKRMIKLKCANKLGLVIQIPQQTLGVHDGLIFTTLWTSKFVDGFGDVDTILCQTPYALCSITLSHYDLGGWCGEFGKSNKKRKLVGNLHDEELGNENGNLPETYFVGYRVSRPVKNSVALVKAPLCESWETFARVSGEKDSPAQLSCIQESVAYVLFCVNEQSLTSKVGAPFNRKRYGT